MHSCGAERKTEISLVVSCQPPDLLVQASDCRKPIRKCQEMASRYEVRLEAAVARRLFSAANNIVIIHTF